MTGRSLWITIISAAVMVGSLTATCAGAQKGDNAMMEKVERFVKPLLDSDSVNALSLGFVDGDKTYVLNFGKLSADKPVAPDADTVYEIGSITKVFTATILADMAEHKEIALTDPVAKYLPANASVPRYEGTAITLLDLVTQCSGLPRMPANFSPKDPTNPYKDYTPNLMLAFLAGYQLPHKPGEKFEYSNLGIGLLGYALAHRAGTDYETLVKKRLLTPLQMNDSGMTLTPAMKARLAPGHDADGEPAANWDFDALAGAGALRSSVNDMLRFLRANLGMGAPELQPAFTLAQKAVRPVSELGQIGLVWPILPDGKTTWHNGGTGGYRSMLALNREKRQGVVVLCNTANEAVTPLGFALLKLLAGETPEPLKLPSVAHVDPAILERYVGQYQLGPGAVLTVTRKADHLAAQLTGQSAFRIYPSSEKEFYYRVVPAQITFETGADGKVEQLVLHQNGLNQTAKKIN
jgi:D-alanyl-D-alanine-carboxypeptidase/D-alanyl-D-alanine-endopeptidase